MAVLVSGDGHEPLIRLVWTELERAARVLNVTLQRLQVPAARERLDVVTDGMFLLHRIRLAELTTKKRLPSIHGLRENVEAGELMSYGPSNVAMFRRVALFVDKILKGAKPADLPVE